MSFVADAFDALGGDRHDAVRSARGYSSVPSWVNWQITYAGAAGATAMLVPGAHLPAMVADLAFLLHKMAYCCWGVGALVGSQVDGKDDLSCVLGMWSGQLQEGALDAAFAGAVVGGGVALAVAAPQTFVAAGGVAAKIAAKELAKSAGLKKAAGLAGFVGGKMGEKVAAKLTLKIGSKTAAKTLVGWLPVVGAVCGAGCNGWLVSSISDSAETFYRVKKKHFPA